jgi:hypothetical protein
MIDAVDRELSAWLRSIAGDLPVSLALPREDAGASVGLYLLEILRSVPTQPATRRPLELSLRYLVTAFAEDPQDAHACLGRVLVAALERTDLQVEMGTLDLSLWSALGLAPRPAFCLVHPWAVRRESPAGIIRQLPEIRATIAMHLRGAIVTSSGVPVPNVRVELPDLALSVATDAAGRFVFGAVPASARERAFRVRARGESYTLSASRRGDAAERAGDDGAPLVLVLDEDT